MSSKLEETRSRIPVARRSAWMVFLQAYKVVMDGVEEALAQKADLTLPEFEVLAWLFDKKDGRMRMQDIAEMLLVSRGHASRLVAGLESAGFLHREINESDRRGVYAVITERGAKQFEEAAPIFVEAYNQTFSGHLSDADVELMDALMMKIVEGNGRRRMLGQRTFSSSPRLRRLAKVSKRRKDFVPQ